MPIFKFDKNHAKSDIQTRPSAQADGRKKTPELSGVFYTDQLKYLFKRPLKPAPWRASSFAISCTVSWIAS